MALPYAAAHESVFALEAQVIVGLAPVPLTAELQPQGAAVTAVLEINTGSVYLASMAH